MRYWCFVVNPAVRSTLARSLAAFRSRSASFFFSVSQIRDLRESKFLCIWNHLDIAKTSFCTYLLTDLYTIMCVRYGSHFDGEVSAFMNSCIRNCHGLHAAAIVFISPSPIADASIAYRFKRKCNYVNFGLFMAATSFTKKLYIT